MQFKICWQNEISGNTITKWLFKSISLLKLDQISTEKSISTENSWVY